jgi:hypothetical protein
LNRNPEVQLAGATRSRSLPDQTAEFFSTGAWTFAQGWVAAGPFDHVAWDESGLAIHGDSTVPGRFAVSFAGVGEFHIDFSEKRVCMREAAPASPDTIRHLINDQIVPRILAHEGELVLHAAGIGTDAGAILFVGLSGSGKSTLAASFHNSGYPLLGDDAIVASVTNGAGSGRAVYRSLRLFPDSVAALVAPSAELASVAPYTSKRSVIYPDDVGTEQPLPIQAAFILEPLDTDELVVQRMTPSGACMAFVEHSFWMDPTDLARTKQRMMKASELAARVPAFRLAYPRDYVALPAVHDTITAALA